MTMARRHSPAEIRAHLARAEALLAQGSSIVEVVRDLGISRMTFYRWRQEGGLSRQDLARRVRELERENVELRRRLGEAGAGQGRREDARSSTGSA
ncbi:MAG TPA: transposase [Azospirillaceae bacterium]|nr:transposase [Azospirillaceae bacterium]